MKVPGNYDSYLVFNLEQFFHCHLFVLGDPSGSVHASEAAAAAVLVEEDVIKLDLHEGSAWRQHLIMALGTGSFGGRKEGGLIHSATGNKATAAACGLALEHTGVRVTPLLCIYGVRTISCLTLHTFPVLCMDFVRLLLLYHSMCSWVLLCM